MALVVALWLKITLDDFMINVNWVVLTCLSPPSFKGANNIGSFFFTHFFLQITKEMYNKIAFLVMNMEIDFR